MDDKEVGNYWEKNAENWTKLARSGYDRCRNLINSPAFFKMLPNIKGLKGLDIGCGEGYNTRIAAEKGAILTAIDLSETFIKLAEKIEKDHPLGIKYQIASALNLPFPANHFDFIMATMSLMDVADNEKAITEAFRVLKPGGFFQFSISHPFSTGRWKWERDESGRKIALTVNDYFNHIDGEIEEWIFGAAPKEITDNMEKFRVPRFHHTLADWLNMLIKSGFILEEFCEPHIEDEALKEHPEEYDSLIVPLFLIIRCRK
jgi:ubiquinone/menaquinone biosynthesis C-methylase UbiE